MEKLSIVVGVLSGLGAICLVLGFLTVVVHIVVIAPFLEWRRTRNCEYLILFVAGAMFIFGWGQASADMSTSSWGWGHG